MYNILYGIHVFVSNDGIEANSLGNIAGYRRLK